MGRFTTEFKVGIFVLVAAGLIGFSWIWTYDGVRGDEEAFTVRLVVDSADGLWKGSEVRLAGVEVGAIEAIAVHPKGAVLDLRIRKAYQLPIDSTAELKSTGLLGDYFIRVYPGNNESLIADGGWIELGKSPGDIDNITRQVEDITEDISAITEVLRLMIEDRSNTDNVEATIDNVNALSMELRLIAEQNHGDINAIADSVLRLTESLEAYTTAIGDDVGEEMEVLKETTETLRDAMEDVESITSKIDRGEGTVGALINERDTVDAINDTIENANSVVQSFSGLHAEIYYTGRYYFGSQPRDTQTFFYGNPLAGSAANTLGIRLKPQEDFWWIFEVNDTPQGTIRNKETFDPDTLEVERKWVREDNYRFTFQMMKRWRSLGFRLGVKENGGGVGMTVWAFKDRLRMDADVFDFAFGSYPAVQDAGIPNVRVGARFEPWKNMYIEAGAEQIILGIKHGYGTGFIGGGFYFTDDDIKLLLATLPLNL